LLVVGATADERLSGNSEALLKSLAGERLPIHVLIDGAYTADLLLPGRYSTGIPASPVSVLQSGASGVLLRVSNSTTQPIRVLQTDIWAGKVTPMYVAQSAHSVLGHLPVAPKAPPHNDTAEEHRNHASSNHDRASMLLPHLTLLICLRLQSVIHVVSAMMEPRNDTGTRLMIT
jgi:hypothetical protein